MKNFTKIGAESITVGGKYKRQVIVKRFRTEDGKQHEFTTYDAEGKHSGAVLAITTDGKVVTTYQFRAGPERWLHELPGGGIFDGEDPGVGVLRELKEETGYVPKKVESLGTLDARDAYRNGIWHYFIATGCELSEGGRELDAEESDQGAEVQLITIEQLIKNAKTSQMTDPIAVLMAYDKLKELEAKHDQSN